MQQNTVQQTARLDAPAPFAPSNKHLLPQGRFKVKLLITGREPGYAYVNEFTDKGSLLEPLASPLTYTDCSSGMFLLLHGDDISDVIQLKKLHFAYLLCAGVLSVYSVLPAVWTW